MPNCHAKWIVTLCESDGPTDRFSSIARRRHDPSPSKDPRQHPSTIANVGSLYRQTNRSGLWLKVRAARAFCSSPATQFATGISTVEGTANPRTNLLKLTFLVYVSVG